MAAWWKILLAVVVVVIVLVAVIAITAPDDELEVVTNEERLASIPSNATKHTPATDVFKPVVLVDGWEQPVPMPGPVNTAGAEDSPFIIASGDWFFFFFTPDVKVPVEKQLLDGVTGIWWMKKNGTTWTSPEKVVLHDDLSLDGAEFVLGNTMWFASVRVGNLGEIDIYTAVYEDGQWTDVTNAGQQLNVDYNIGEFHITSDGQTLFFHSGTVTEEEDMDLWYCDWTGDDWGTPQLVPGVNTDAPEGWPYVSPDGNELWFTSFSSVGGYQGPSIYRSVKLPNGTWDTPVEVVANFAGEPTLDEDGNIYFVHHYFTEDSEMLEADIYVCYKE